MTAPNFTDFTTTGRWLGPTERPLAGWLTTPTAGPSPIGVLILPSLGYEYVTAHRTLRTLAEQLARRGCMVLRVDYDGTGDSAGDRQDSRRVEAWRGSAGAGVVELRSLGAVQVTLIGLRVGATIALLDGGDHGVDQIVAIAPLASARRYVRQLTLLGQPVPNDPGSLSAAGSFFHAETLADLAALDHTPIAVRPAARVLVVDRNDQSPNVALVARLEACGCEVDHRVVDGLDGVLDLPTEDAVVPLAVLEGIVAWVKPNDDAAARLPAALPNTATTMTWHGSAITEEIIVLGDQRMVAVRGRSVGAARATILWLNSGSEPHTGPGRAWVEYGRALNVAGYDTVRLDFRGWGESPDDGHRPGRPYDPHTIDDTRTAVDALRHDGAGPIVLAGLCAGAWAALRVATDMAVDGVIAINPQLYWQPGDPVEALLSDTHTRRLAEIARYKQDGARLEAEGDVHPATTWMRDLTAARIPILALFAAGDDGLDFLRDRLPDAWRAAQADGRVRTVEIDGIDHPMHRLWHRPEVVSAIVSFLDTDIGSLDSGR